MYQRTHARVGLKTVAHLDLLCTGNKTFAEALVGGLLDEEARRRHTDLTRIAVLALVGKFERGVEVTVVKHEHRRVTAELHGGPLQPVGGQLDQVLADRHRPGERYLADDGRGEQVARNRVGHAEYH